MSLKKIIWGSTILIWLGLSVYIGRKLQNSIDVMADNYHSSRYQTEDFNNDGRLDICLGSGLNRGKYPQYLIQNLDGTFELTDLRGGSTPSFKGINFDYSLDGRRSPINNPFSSEPIPYNHRQRLLPGSGNKSSEDADTEDSVIGSQGSNLFFRLL